MGLINSLFARAIVETAMIRAKNQSKIQEAIDKYWEACKYPRKKKKQMRKEANKDYQFWMSLENFYKNSPFG